MKNFETLFLKLKTFCAGLIRNQTLIPSTYLFPLIPPIPLYPPPMEGLHPWLFSSSSPLFLLQRHIITYLYRVNWLSQSLIAISVSVSVSVSLSVSSQQINCVLSALIFHFISEPSSLSGFFFHYTKEVDNDGYLLHNHFYHFNLWKWRKIHKFSHMVETLNSDLQMERLRPLFIERNGKHSRNYVDVID